MFLLISGTNVTSTKLKSGGTDALTLVSKRSPIFNALRFLKSYHWAMISSDEGDEDSLTP